MNLWQSLLVKLVASNVLTTGLSQSKLYTFVLPNLRSTDTQWKTDIQPSLTLTTKLHMRPGICQEDDDPYSSMNIIYRKISR